MSQSRVTKLVPLRRTACYSFTGRLIRRTSKEKNRSNGFTGKNAAGLAPRTERLGEIGRAQPRPGRKKLLTKNNIAAKLLDGTFARITARAGGSRFIICEIN